MHQSIKSRISDPLEELIGLSNGNALKTPTIFDFRTRFLILTDLNMGHHSSGDVKGTRALKRVRRNP